MWSRWRLLKTVPRLTNFAEVAGPSGGMRPSKVRIIAEAKVKTDKSYRRTTYDSLMRKAPLSTDDEPDPRVSKPTLYIPRRNELSHNTK
jgi:hypothetical protein